MTDTNLIFRARALLAQHQKLAELQKSLAEKMKQDLDSGEYAVSWHNYPEKGQIEEADGILDRMRRDLVNMLSKEPTTCVALCEAIEQRAAPPQIFRNPWLEAIDAAEKLQTSR